MSSFMHDNETFYTIANALATLKLGHSDNGPIALVLRKMNKKEAAEMPGYDVRSPRKIALDIVQSWFNANKHAVEGRYKGRSADMVLTEATLLPGTKQYPLITLTQLYKIVQSVKYQCCEDVAKEHKRSHAKAVKEMETLLPLIASAVVEGSQEYEDAGWSTPGYDEQKARVKREMARRRAESAAV